MVKVDVPIRQIMDDPELSIMTSPFAPGKMIIKHASFRKGEVPAHLEDYLIREGECSGYKGTVVYKGKKIPKVALCVAVKHSHKPIPRKYVEMIEKILAPRR